MKKIDEELKALNMEDQGKEPEPAGDADFEAAIEKAVNRRIKKIVFKTLAAVLACVVALTLCLNPLMNALLPNAKAMNEVTEDDVGNRVERTELEKLLSAYYEVSTPYVEIYTVDVDSKGFAIIRSLGDKALFNLDTALLKRKLGAPNNRPLADFLPTLNIKAKDFAAEMTSVNVQQKDLHGQQTICQEHVDNNKAVRNMMLQRGIVPEDLPAGEDVKKVERRLKSDEKTLTKKNSKKK